MDNVLLEGYYRKLIWVSSRHWTSKENLADISEPQVIHFE